MGDRDARREMKVVVMNYGNLAKNRWNINEQFDVRILDNFFHHTGYKICITT